MTITVHFHYLNTDADEVAGQTGAVTAWCPIRTRRRCRVTRSSLNHTAFIEERDGYHEAFLVVGQLNHTFALNSAHSRFRVGSHQQIGAARAGLRGAVGIFHETFVACSFSAPQRGMLLANVSGLGSVFPQVRPQTNAANV